MITFNRFSETFEDDIDSLDAMMMPVAGDFTAEGFGGAGTFTIIDTSGFGTPTTNVLASSGDAYAVLTGTVTTSFDGERLLGEGAEKAFSTSVDIYIDTAYTTGAGDASDESFVFTASINISDGAGGDTTQDYTIELAGATLAADAGTTATNDPVAVTTTGWYTLEQSFTEAADGSLLVTFTVTDAMGTPVLQETISELGIDFDTEFFGNGSASYTAAGDYTVAGSGEGDSDAGGDVDSAGIAVDNFQLNTADDNPVQVLVNGVIIASYADEASAKAAIADGTILGAATSAVISTDLGTDDDYLYVAGDLTIQDAIDDSAGLGVADILVAGGTYEEQLAVNQSVSLEAEGNVTVAGIETPTTATAVVSAANVTIDGFTILGTAAQAAVEVTGGVAGFELMNSTLTAAGTSALIADLGADAVLDGNTFNGQTFVGTMDSNQPTTGTDAPAVLVDLTGAGIEVTDNTFAGVTSGIDSAAPNGPLTAEQLTLAGDNGVIADNTFTGAGLGLDTALTVTGDTTGTTLDNNDFDNSAGAGNLDIVVNELAAAMPTPNDFIGGAGDDTIAGTDLDDVITTGDADAGEDPVAQAADAVDDEVAAGAGDDTVTAGAGDDSLEGEAGDDMLMGGAGDDELLGGDGDDIVDGGAGDDMLIADAGTDQLIGGDGSDTVDFTGATSGILLQLSGNPFDFVVAGEGFATSSFGTDGLTGIENVIGAGLDDALSGNAMANVFAGAAGNDFLAGLAGDDSLDGGADDDEVNGGDGNDELLGGTGMDTLSGEAGDDNILGGDDDDEAYGGAGDDTVAGGAGADMIFGAAGSDVLAGEAGADEIFGGDGIDTLSGGDGADMLFGGADNDVVAGGNGNDTVDGGNGNDVLTGVIGADVVQGRQGNDLVVGGAGNDFVNGGDGDDSVAGGEDDDMVFGGTGADLLNGGLGDDLISSGDGNDQAGGAAGEDTILGGAGDDILSGGDGDDVLAGNAGNDVIAGGADNDFLNGGAGDDLQTGNAGNDTVLGDTGNDTLIGGEGNDAIEGGDDDDILYGNQGLDVLNGEAGDDLLFGGTGADVFEASLGNDVIADFDGDEDSVDLSAFAQFTSFASVLIAGENTADGYVIDLGDGNTLTLTGVVEANLEADDFGF